MLSNMRGAKTCFNCRLIWRPKDKRSQRDATSPVPPEKINRFVIDPNHRYNSPVTTRKRGVSRSSRTWVGCGGR
jgi:hypothetical protein